MKIQYASDLHYEMIADPTFIGLTPAPDADVLVLAGDIGIGAAGIARFKDWPVPVVYVHGNHELYRCQDMGRAIAALREASTAAGIHFLEKDAVVIDGVRFLGTALWTDYCLDGADDQETAMLICNVFVSDTKLIRTQGRLMQAQDFARRHATSRAWLEAQLDIPFDGKTIVVTHHAPHGNSVPEGSKDGRLRAAYGSNLQVVMETHHPPALWFHGHMHISLDYLVHKTRVLANPRGYPAKGPWPAHSMFQNRKFEPTKTVTV